MRVGIFLGIKTKSSSTRLGASVYGQDLFNGVVVWRELVFDGESTEIVKVCVEKRSLTDARLQNSYDKISKMGVNIITESSLSLKLYGFVRHSPWKKKSFFDEC
ncbi:hypothetical protein CEXT_29951 [Caerostris extrusa]|uniref:Uncharacterized protein n=1 Tax=Caerostris extrusa TaxID=172846 RepID=A0AAV4YB03_CAEEX|nr:hypothetical protein CEXT_29951 [Caerostris extrusa]